MIIHYMSLWSRFLHSKFTLRNDSACYVVICCINTPIPKRMPRLKNSPPPSGTLLAARYVCPHLFVPGFAQPARNVFYYFNLITKLLAKPRIKGNLRRLKIDLLDEF